MNYLYTLIIITTSANSDGVGTSTLMVPSPSIKDCQIAAQMLTKTETIHWPNGALAGVRNTIAYCIPREEKK